MSLPPAVTAIIPAYNYARFLPAAIESVLSQEYPQFELLILDDGSTDETPSVAARYNDPRVRYLRQENAGLSAARNTGIRNARFDFIAFLDADDQWLPGFLRTVMETFAKLPPEFAMIATASLRVDPSGTRIGTGQNCRISSDMEYRVRDFILKNPAPLSSSVIVRRSVFETCGYFDTSLRSSEDRDMWIRIASRHRVYFLTAPLALLRRHPNNMSKQADRMKQSMWTVIRKAYRSGAAPAWDIPFWLRVCSFYYFQISWTHFDEGRRAEATRFVLTSLLLWPVPFLIARLNVPPFFRPRALFHFLFRQKVES